MNEKKTRAARIRRSFSTHLIHAHARIVGVGTEPNDDDAVFFGKNRLVDGPSVSKVW